MSKDILKRKYGSCTVLDTTFCRITEQAVIDAAAGGDVDFMHYALSHGAPITDATLSAAVNVAALNGHLDCIRSLIAQEVTLTSQATKSAAMGGHIECLKLLIDHNCPRDANCVSISASAGDLGCLVCLLQTDSPVDSTAATAAVTNGHAQCLAALLQCVDQALVSVECIHIAAKRINTDCLQVLFNAGVPLNLSALQKKFSRRDGMVYLRRLVLVGYRLPSSAASNAITSQNFDCIQYLCEVRRVDLTSDLCIEAARQSDLQYIKLLHKHNCPWDATACATAAACNNLMCLKFLHDKGCPWDVTTYLTMAVMTKPPRDCLIYALENGCPLGEPADVRQIVRFIQRIGVSITVVMTNAAVGGASIDCMEELLSSGAPMDASTCAAAARYDPALPSRPLNMLKFMRSQGCPWDKRTCDAAAAHPTTACLRYVHEEDHSLCTSMALAAASNGSRYCLLYAIQNGCMTWLTDEAVLLAAAAQPNTECLEVLHNAGSFRCSVSVTLAAASAGSLACLEYAREHKCPWDGTVGKAAAKHPACFYYCVEKGCPFVDDVMEE